MKLVKFNKFIPLEYIQKVGTTNKTRVEGTGGFEIDFKSKGLFHQWGVNYEEFENGAVNYTIAIVELSDGTIEEVLPCNIQFDKTSF